MYDMFIPENGALRLFLEEQKSNNIFHIMSEVEWKQDKHNINVAKFSKINDSEILVIYDNYDFEIFKL